MRLFAKVDGAVDRFERAGLLTMPFDLALSPPVDVSELVILADIRLSRPRVSGGSAAIPAVSDESLEVSG